jgi:uncharacterized membrane protein
MTRPSARALSDIALLVLAGCAALVIALDAQPVRPFVVFAAACFVPGGALLTQLRTGETLSDLALAVTLSIALEIAGSLVLAWTGWWHPEVLAIVLGVAATAFLVADLCALRAGE